MRDDSASHYAGIEELLAVERAMPAYNRSIVSIFTRTFKDAQLVADFGAGIGTLAEIYRQKSRVAPKCVEIDAICGGYLRNRGFEQAERIGAWGNEMQGVYSSNVLEHIEDDIGALEDIHAALAPGGRLVLYLPAFQVLFSGLDEAVGHYRRYGRREIVEKCRRVGFTVERAHYCDSIGFFASLSVKLLGYDKDAGLGSDASLRIYDKLVFPVSRIADALGFKDLFGKNVVVVARKG